MPGIEKIQGPLPLPIKRNELGFWGLLSWKMICSAVIVVRLNHKALAIGLS